MQLKSEEFIDHLVAIITSQYRTFGGATNSDNPIAQAMKDRAPVFAAGVDVREVVTTIAIETSRLILNKMNELEGKIS